MRVFVAGSGAWGTALAIRLSKNGHEVAMWVRRADAAQQMRETRCNPRLPGAVLPDNLIPTCDYHDAAGCQLVVIASPSFPLRSVCRSIASLSIWGAMLRQTLRKGKEGEAMTTS